ncbi:MAG: hypothetical protein GWO02_23325 [Gammaproteobacteria bacterium]|nr:hypothetical protein [Gammaproteobacteria bacterium]
MAASPPSAARRCRCHDMYSMKRVLPQPVGPLSSTGICCS